MIMETDKSRKLPPDTAFLGTMLALALALHTMERLVPPFPVPGVKIGLANIASLIVLVGWGWRDALLITFLRVICGSLLGGTFLGAGFIIALSGGMMSILGMQAAQSIALRSPRLISVVGVSCIGAAFHNLGQITSAAFILHDTAVIRFLPFLLLLALPSGFLTGIIAKRVISMLNYMPQFSGNATVLTGTGARMGDWVLGAVLLICGAGLLIFPMLHTETAGRAIVKFNGIPVEVVDLGKDGYIRFEMSGARMVFEVRNHKVRVAESNCDNRNCVADGWIGTPGQMLVCIPNGVVLSTPSENSEEEIDAVTY